MTAPSFSPIGSTIVKKLFDEILPLATTPTPSESALAKVCEVDFNKAQKYLETHLHGFSKPTSGHSKAILIAWAWCVRNTDKPSERHEKNIMKHMHNVFHGLYLSQIELDKALQPQH